MQFLTGIVQLPLLRQSANVQIRTPQDASDLCKDVADLAQESFHVLALNVRNRMVGRCLATLGTADACLVHPREVFRCAIMLNASSIVLVHNHPSGDTSPSPEDVAVTRQLIEAGKVVGIRILDHVIIGPKRKDVAGPVFLSMREAGLCTFDR